MKGEQKRAFFTWDKQLEQGRGWELCGSEDPKQSKTNKNPQNMGVHTHTNKNEQTPRKQNKQTEPQESLELFGDGEKSKGRNARPLRQAIRRQL